MILNNVSFRVVGIYLRINDPYNTAVPPPEGPTQIDIPELNVSSDTPKVADVMNAVQFQIGTKGQYQYSFATGQKGILSRMSYSQTVFGGFTYSLDAESLGQKTGVSFAWQYYIYKKNLEDPNMDVRVPVYDRALYDQPSSPTIEDNYRIIWRLVPIDMQPGIRGSKAKYG